MSQNNGLPKNFVTAMRTLFDIMDDRNTGYVNYSEIEARWRDDGASGLPKGILDGLKKITPTNGLLTFERFCAGLKICLLNAQAELDAAQQSAPPPPPPPLPPLQGHATTSSHIVDPRLMKTYGPPKPPRTGAALDSRVLNADRSCIDKSEIRTALQNWQMGLMMGTAGDKSVTDKRQLSNVKYNTDVLHQSSPLSTSQQLVLAQNKKSPSRRREPRRHTLQNGIDYNMMKRMKQIEQEKDVLLQGLAAVEKARDWYMKQISIAQEKIKHLGRMGSHVEQWTEAQQERLELQRVRVLEVNRHLAALISSWDRGGLPLHMNLAINNTTLTRLQQDMLSRLKQQNHRLAEEEIKKNHRIAQEKDNLVRQTGIAVRSTIQSNHDQTFII